MVSVALTLLLPSVAVMVTGFLPPPNLPVIVLMTKVADLLPSGTMTAGIVGTVIGTLGGRRFRSRLAAAFGSDRPAAIVEDVVAIGSALLIVAAMR